MEAAQPLDYMESSSIQVKAMASDGQVSVWGAWPAPEPPERKGQYECHLSRRSRSDQFLPHLVSPLPA